MSWLYLPEPAEECSALDCSDGGPSDTSSGTDTAVKYSSRASRMGVFIPLPSGAEMSENLFAADVRRSIREWLTSFQQDFPASHSPELAANSEKTTPGTCGPQPPRAFASFDHLGSFWKMSRPCDADKKTEAPATSTEFSATWPRSGIVQDGIAYQLPPSAPITRGTESGSLPTPTATEYGSNKSASKGAKRRPSLGQLARIPTPTVHGNYNRPREGTNSGLGLATFVRLFPTPIASDATRGPTTYQHGNPSLLKAALTYPTPTANDAKTGAGIRNREGRSPKLSETVGGRLNPRWEEWLMGWPIGWTKSEPLETAKFQQWLRAFGDD